MKHRKTTIYALSLCSAAILLALHPMITSTYISASGSLTQFASTVVLMLLLLSLTARCAESPFPIYAVTVAALLSIGNAAALPLLQYTSACEHATKYAGYISTDTSYTILSIPFVWFMFSGMVWLRKQSDMKQNVTVAAAAGISVIYSILSILLTDSTSGTTIIEIGGGMEIQAAIPAFMLSLLLICLFVKTDGKIRRTLLCGSVILMNAVLVIRKETGLPLILFAGCSFYYFFLQPHRSKWLSYGIPVLSGAGCICAWILHCLHGSLNEESFLYSLSSKIEKRIAADSVDQLNKAIQSLQTGSWFGSEGYNVYLTEASSDLSVITILHYCGMVYLLLILAAAIPMFFTGAMHITSRKMKSENVLCGLCYSVFFIIFFYNLFMSVGITPIVGVQMPFTGASIMYAVFSGFLLGSVCYPKKAIKTAIAHMKGDDFQCVTPKETV